MLDRTPRDLDNTEADLIAWSRLTPDKRRKVAKVLCGAVNSRLSDPSDPFYATRTYHLLTTAVYTPHDFGISYVTVQEILQS